MEQFVVSARKYRPHYFREVVGQTHITTTLQNAIKNQQVAQALLFHGPGGVGKTTMARILARTINCNAPTEEIEACNTCPACKSNIKGALNIYELDAASNNTVEGIRSIVEQVRYLPASGTHKVYIVDEAHMLSNAASNAFLKTLEEPPQHGVFILATTEKHKIIPTILSRCQIFDFRRLQIQELVQQLLHVAKQEGIDCEESALHLISHKAAGSLRDALSMFDLILTFEGQQKLTYQHALQHLNVLDHDYYFKLTDALSTGNVGKALLVYNNVLEKGFDGHQFLIGLSEHLRNLLVCQDPTTVGLLDVPPAIQGTYQKQASQVDEAFLGQALDYCNQCDLHYKTSLNPRLHVELALIKLAQSNAKLNEVTSKNASYVSQASVSNQSLVADPAPTSTTPDRKTPATQSAQRQTQKAPTQSSPASKSTATTLKNTVKIPTPAQIQAQVTHELNASKPGKEEITQVRQTSELTAEALEKPWQNYSNRLKETGQATAHDAMQQPKTIQGHKIVLHLTHTVHQDILKDFKPELLTYLRSQLNNPIIQLQTVQKKLQKTHTPYTDYEKFNALAKTYPNLLLLKERLDLDLD